MDSSESEKRRQTYEREDRVPDLQPSEVEKRTLLYELEDELRKLIRRRFWIFLFFGAVVGYGAIKLVVEQVAATPLKEIQKEYAQAQLMAELAKKGASDAMDAAGQVNAQLSLRQKDVDDLQQKAKVVEKQFGLVTEQINAAAKNAEVRSGQDFQANQERISRLEALVKKIGQENEASRKAYADYKEQIDKITAETARQQKRFAENSRYTVVISSSPEQRPLAEKVQNELAIVGFKASLIPVPPPGVPASTDPATGEPWKGNHLTYSPESEMKAQEILALIKPIVKDVRLRLWEPPKIPRVPGGPPIPLPPEMFRNQFSINLGS
jgi:hypothetical protein